ncbi:hypothetical protein [Megasphaera elsdenii]|uniref:hypothetical protein n=1 Tax=Megasphaera elsdenii TaxID=907 RepID=UPI001472E4FC|nr:hypothetical protein [Megasphaera elsdenii]NME19440.1 DUF456 domain-containing protein [Megasphaera elsdenii]
MLLKENPFYLLEIDSLTSKQGINEAADDKSFDDPDNEEKYENARDSLFNLRKRVNAEISWFLGMSWQDVPKSESELKSRQNYPNPIANFTAILNEIPDLSVEDAVVKIPELDSLYLKLKPEIIKQIINQDRKKAGIALVQDNEIIDEGLKNLDEDVHQAILKLTRKMKQPVYTRLANEIAENLVRQKASYGNLLLRFFDTYDLDITKYVLDEEKEIKKILSDKNIIHKASSFSDLEIHVRKVASMTKARCLLTDAKGTEDFGEIIRIFQFIYDKFFDFYNEDHDANLSYRIIILLKDNFPIIAKKKSGFEKNFETIKDIVSREGEKNRNKHTSQLVNTSQVYQDAEAAFEEILSQINTRGHFADGYKQENSSFLYNDFEKSYKNIVYSFLHRTGYSPEEMVRVHEYAAIIYLQIANLSTWIDAWNLTRKYANLAYEQARYSNDMKLRQKVENLKNELAKVDATQAVSQTKKSSESTTIRWVLIICTIIGIAVGGLEGALAGFLIGCFIANSIEK